MKKNKKYQSFINFTKKAYRLLPEIISVSLQIVLIWTLVRRLTGSEENIKTLQDTKTELMAFSGFLAGLIIAYLSSKVLQIRQERLTEFPELNEYTQKLHKARSIIHKLLNSEIIKNDTKSYIDSKYKGLSYIDIRESNNVGYKTTQKKEKMLDDFGKDEKAGGIAKLYLGLKSFVPSNRFDETLYSEFDVPKFYSTNIVENWDRYDCANVFWFYFEHKYQIHKDKLDFNNIYEPDKQSILETVVAIDRERYKGLDFGHELLSKFGNQLKDDILPKLYRLQTKIEKGLPTIVKLLFAISATLILFGFILPIINKIFCFHYIMDIISVSATISMSVYLLTGFCRFLKKEVKIY